MDDQDNNSEFYRKAEENLRAGRVDKALRQLSAAEALSKIEAHKSNKTRSLTITLIGFVTVVVITLGLLIRVPATDIVLTIKTNGFLLQSQASSQPVLARWAATSAGISIDETDYFHTLPINRPKELDHDQLETPGGDINIEAKSILLDQLSIETSRKSVTIIVDQGQSNVDLYVKGASLSGHLAIDEASQFTIMQLGEENSLMIEGDIRRRDYRYFRTEPYGSAAIPHSIRFFEVSNLEFAVENLESAQFSREFPPGSGQSESTVIGGSLHLLDVDREIQLREHEELRFWCENCAQNSVRFEQGFLIFELRGSVSRIDWGYGDDLREYTPSLLEYIYHNQKIAMLWAAALFVFGIFWKLKKEI